MRIIDLSHPIKTGMPAYPGTPEVLVTQIATHQKHHYSEHQFTLTSHTGTHMDAPYHMIEDGKTLEELGGIFYGNALCVPMKNDDIIEAIQEAVRNDVEYLIIHTGHNVLWKEEHHGKYSTLTTELATMIAESPIKGVGFDTPSADEMGSTTFPIHHILLVKDTVIFENLTNLDKLPRDPFTFVAAPLFYERADGAPIRAFALLTKE